MAKIKIEFEDIDNGKYSISCTPNERTIAEKHKNGHPLTAAESKALVTMASIMKIIVEEQKDAREKASPIII